MGPRFDARTLAGSCALAATLALSTPGVQANPAVGPVSEAPPAAMSEVPPAPMSVAPPAAIAPGPGRQGSSCRVGGGGTAGSTTRKDSAGALARLQQRMQAELAEGGEAPVVLNGSGYNYGSGTDLAQQVRLLELEAKRQRSKP